MPDSKGSCDLDYRKDECDGESSSWVSVCSDSITEKAKRFKAKRRGGSDEEDDGSDDQPSIPSGSNSMQAAKRQKSFTVLLTKAISFGPDKQVAFENQLFWAWISAGFSFFFYFYFYFIFNSTICILEHESSPALNTKVYYLSRY